MGRIHRFVVPSVKRIEIDGGDWIELKGDLTTGETKILENAGVKTPVMLNGSPWTPIDSGIYEMTKVQLFLVDWSFRDENDKPVKVSIDALRNLEPADFATISRAVSKHIADRAVEKKELRDSMILSSPIKPVDEPPSL